MPKMRLLLSCLIPAAALLLAVSCESEVREANINQNKYIDDYIKANFSENEIVRYEGVVRVVVADSLTGSRAVEPGDSAFLYYAGFTFTQKGPAGPFVEDSAMVRVGKGDLITGLDRGLVGARIGEENLVFFPAELGYGTSSVGLVPENSALMFDFLVADIKKNQ